MASNYEDQARLQPLIDYLQRVILNNFGHLVETVYQGDIGMYPPSAFRDSNNNYKLALRIVVDRMFSPDDREKSPMGEYRTIRFNIIPMVNMVPHFEATPQAAFGEVELLEFIDQFFEYFRRTENIDLGGYATTALIKEINFGFEERGELSIRSAAIQLEVKLYFENM